MNKPIQRIVPTWRLKQVAMLKNKTRLQRENKQLRDALSLIYDIAPEGLRTDDGGAGYWQIEASSAAALGLSNKERDINPETHKVKLFVTIGDNEYDLLYVLSRSDWRVSELEQAGYAKSMQKLQACEFAWEVNRQDIPYLIITPKGREFIQKDSEEV